LLVVHAELPWVRSLVLLHPSAFRPAHPPRTVNNIYFDTPNFDMLRDGIDGLSFRVKTRIRWYGDLTGFVEPVLQLKRRENLDGYKEETSLRSMQILSRHPWTDVLKRVAPTRPQPVDVMLQGLHPTLINQYRRDYFASMCGRFRLTLDYNLRYFDQTLSSLVNLTRPVPSQPYFVIELKYDPLQDTIGHDLASWFPFRVTRSSKYKTGMCGGTPT